MWKILMLEISAKKGLCYVICGSEVKTSDLAAHFHKILALQIRFCLLFKRVVRVVLHVNGDSPRERGGGWTRGGFLLIRVIVGES